MGSTPSLGTIAPPPMHRPEFSCISHVVIFWLLHPFNPFRVSTMKYKLRLYLHYDGLDDDIRVSSRSPQTHPVLPELRRAQFVGSHDGKAAGRRIMSVILTSRHSVDIVLCQQSTSRKSDDRVAERSVTARPQERKTSALSTSAPQRKSAGTHVRPDRNIISTARYVSRSSIFANVSKTVARRVIPVSTLGGPQLPQMA